jgi:dTDP-4-dehydrorhamnose reductase
MKIIVLGISGMLGHRAFRRLSERSDLEVYGTLRSGDARRFFATMPADRIIDGVDVENQDSLVAVLNRVRPDAAINCIGIVNQRSAAMNPLSTIPINALLPHRIAQLCHLRGARLIHISTDCVFSGRAGNYRESDPTDADDLYGRSKLLGEVDYGNAITLRTSIIGRELSGRYGLLEWFLGERSKVRGYTNAIFSGLTTEELTSVIADYVLPHRELRGVYHVGAEPIAKYDLLNLVKGVYELPIEIEPDASLRINRSLDSTRFQRATGYVCPAWPQMIRQMRALEIPNDDR